MRARPMVLALRATVLAACPTGDDDDSTGGDDDDSVPVGGPALHLPERFAWCPDGGGGTGEGTLTIGDEAVYCAAFHETRTLAQERDAKAMLWLADGAVAVPTVDGTIPWRLPGCALTADGEELAPSADGELTVTTDLGGSGRYRLQLRQPMGSHELVLWLDGPRDELTADGPAMNGEHIGLATDTDHAVALQLCEGSCGSAAEGLLLDSCRFDRVAAERHHIEFEGGWIDVELRIGQSFLATQPAVFVGGEGELDGAPFVQRDYFEALYNPEHHHFSRDFVLWIDGEDRGVLVEHADPFFDAPAVAVSVIDHDFAVVESRAVTDETYETNVD